MPRSPDARRAKTQLPPSEALAQAEALRLAFGRAASARKLRLLAVLERADLSRPRDVLRLHELLCFWRAYPDDRRLLAKVERLLAGFARRADLARHGPRLADSGIAGTEIQYRFFAPTAFWLARRWPERLHVDWDELDESALQPWLPLVVHPAEVPALDEYDMPMREWIARLKGPSETDGAFLVERLARLPMEELARETLYDQLDPPLILSPGADTPSRTRAKVRGTKVRWQRREPSRERPSPSAIRRIRGGVVREASPREGERLIDLAREAMVTRSRDLDAFSNGDPRDVRVVSFEDGLEFAVIGTRPARRLLLESVYGYLTLKNGVPVGYVLTAALFGSAELAYNVFDTYRGVEAGVIYARVLAMTRQLFGCDAFTIPPYQLGDGNDEALESGAWWFYQKMGFAPRDPRASRIMRSEAARMARDPSLRSSLSTLRRLARSNLFLFLDGARRDVMGQIEIANVGLHASRYLAERYGRDREGAKAACAHEAAAALGGPEIDWSADERGAWEAWAPLALRLGAARWNPSERRALVAVIRAKGGRCEAEFVRRFDAHARLRAGVRRLAASQPPAPRRG